MRACAVLFVLAASRLLSPAATAHAGDNPHNLGSCSACHSTMPRFGVDARRDVTFTTSADDPGLCAPCHPAADHAHPVLVAAGAGPSAGRVSPYLPPGSSPAFAGKIVCVSCHFIHASDTRHSLLRGFPGSPDPRYFASIAAFCQECHGENLTPRSPHAGGTGTCAFCHAGKPQSRKPDSPSAFSDRCQACHRDVKDAHFEKLTPFGRQRICTLCHDRHGSVDTTPGLLSEGYRAAVADSVTINPHFRRGLCFTCHANTDDYTLRDEDVNALCDRCHASGSIRANIHPLRTVPPTIVVPKGWPLTNGRLTCLTCHVQGHEDQPRQRWMLHGGPYESPRAPCRTCHTGTDLEKSRIHLEINEGKSCELCHKARPEPGKDTVKTVTFIASPDLLCLRCHDQNPDDGTVHHADVLGRELEPGHIPAQLPLWQGRIICATCHNPHQKESHGGRLRESLGDTDLCLGCHPG